MLRLGAEGWEFQDLGSTNGTFSGGSRVERVVITGALQLHLGGADGDVIELTALPPRGPAATMVVSAPLDPRATMITPRGSIRPPGPVLVVPPKPLRRMSVVNKLVHDIDGIDDGDTET